MNGWYWVPDESANSLEFPQFLHLQMIRTNSGGFGQIRGNTLPSMPAVPLNSRFLKELRTMTVSHVVHAIQHIHCLHHRHFLEIYETHA